MGILEEPMGKKKVFVGFSILWWIIYVNLINRSSFLAGLSFSLRILFCRLCLSLSLSSSLSLSVSFSLHLCVSLQMLWGLRRVVIMLDHMATGFRADKATPFGMHNATGIKSISRYVEHIHKLSLLCTYQWYAPPTPPGGHGDCYSEGGRLSIFLLVV